MRLLEVKKDGKTYMFTETKECIPSSEVLNSMKSAGYKVYYEGKILREKRNE